MTSSSTRQPSVQLFTVRDRLAEDRAGTLSRLAKIGYTRVEPFKFQAWPEIADHILAAGLTAPTVHAQVRDQDLAALFGAAARAGAHTVFVPSSDREQWHDRDDIASLAAELSLAAKAAADHGLRIGYHNHWWECEARPDGAIGLDVLLEHVDDGVVLELDTYWAAVVGADPVALLRRYGERVAAIHVKDGPINFDRPAQVAIGDGAMPIKAILAAAPYALPVVELDGYTGDPMDAVEKSFSSLTALLGEVDR